MSGDPIEAVRLGVRALIADLRSDPQALETVYLSVITFAGSAVQACPLTELALFQEPNLTAGGSTALGAALRLVEQCIDSEVHKPSKDQKGDWKPLIFLMTDGMPTDNWGPAADNFRTRRLGKVIACAAGDQADPEILKRFVEGEENMVVQLKSLQPDELKRFLKWVSSSVKTTSQAVAGAAPGAGLPPRRPASWWCPDKLRRGGAAIASPWLFGRFLMRDEDIRRALAYRLGRPGSAFTRREWESILHLPNWESNARQAAHEFGEMVKRGMVQLLQNPKAWADTPEERLVRDIFLNLDGASLERVLQALQTGMAAARATRVHFAATPDGGATFSPPPAPPAPPGRRDFSRSTEIRAVRPHHHPRAHHAP